MLIFHGRPPEPMFLKRLYRKFLDIVIRSWQSFKAAFIKNTFGMDALSHYISKLENPACIMKHFGAKIGKRTIIYPGIILHAAKNDYSNLVIGNDCRIGRESFFDLTENITIEDTVNIAMRTTVLTHVNVNRSPVRHLGYEPKSAPVTFKRGSITFANATVLMGVELAECSVLGAGCVISTNTKPYAVYIGNPGRHAKTLKH